MIVLSLLIYITKHTINFKTIAVIIIDAYIFNAYIINLWQTLCLLTSYINFKLVTVGTSWDTAFSWFYSRVAFFLNAGIVISIYGNVSISIIHEF